MHMRLATTLLVSVWLVLDAMPFACAQDLAPRAYIVTPLHSNAVTVTYSYHDGEILLEGAAPVSDSQAKIHGSTISFFHSLDFFGRSANLTASLPYSVGNYQANVGGTLLSPRRSGLLPVILRFSVNLHGGPAMSLGQFRSWKQRTIVGVSLKVVPPTGQYDPTVLINHGSNRWSFKPEIGLSRRWGQWVVDTYGAVWLFTANKDFFSRNQFFPGTNTQTQDPILAFEGHLSYDIKKGGARSWVSVDGNYWYGGRTSLNGVTNRNTLQANSRIGATASVPVSKHHSIKASYSYGVIGRFGGNFQNVAVGWQYSWLGRPN